MIAEAGYWRDGILKWCSNPIQFVRNPEAFNQYNNLNILLEGISLDVEKVDKFHWWHNMDKVFSVKRCYGRLGLAKELVPWDVDIVKAVTHVWHSKALSKIKIFDMRVLLNRIPTRDQLGRRRMLPTLVKWFAYVTFVEL